nr:helix-turn-helix transcriptional regulator [Jeotgalibacillus terrae]
MKSVLTNKVKEWRARHGMTQQELADRMGITRQTIGLIEKGDYAPSVLLALKMADVFGIKVEDLFGVKED